MNPVPRGQELEAQNPGKISENFAIFLRPLWGLRRRGRNKCRATRTASRTHTGQKHTLLELISSGYGTLTGELHPPPRQGNARLTFSTVPFNIIDPPAGVHLHRHPHRWPNTARAAYPTGRSPSARARQARTRICQDEEVLRDSPVLARLVKRSPNELLCGTSII